MKKIFTLFLGVLLFVQIKAQLTVDNTSTPADIIEDIFLANGIFVSNVTFSGDLIQLGTFNGSNSNLGLSSGIIMSTGDINGAIGPNNISYYSSMNTTGLSDVDLLSLNSNAIVSDAAVVEFDFIATGDSLSFQYVFGSEEYAEFVGSNFNDLFAFFISGPGISGTFSNGAVNIAMIPGANMPVSINNLNNGYTNQGPCMNCEYYYNNSDPGMNPDSDSTVIQYDGFTVPMFACIGGLQVGEVYHIKLAIADAGDSAFDSGVFLKGDSFVQVCTADVNFMPSGCMLSHLHADAEYTEQCGTISLSNFSEINIETTECYYEMGDGNETSACEANTLYSYASGGTYTVKLVYKVGDFKAKFTIGEILISDTPPAIPVITQNGDMLEVANWDGTSLLQWYINGAELLGATGSSILIEESGSYTVTANNGCPVTSSPFSALGVAEPVTKNGFSIYPNPSETQANIVLPKGAHTLQLYTLNGRLVSSHFVLNQPMIQLSTTAGVYAVRVSDAEGGTMGSLIWTVN